MESEVIVASECPQSAGTDSTALDGRHSVSDLFGRGQRRRRRQRPPSNVVAVQLPQKRQLLHHHGIVDVFGECNVVIANNGNRRVWIVRSVTAMIGETGNVSRIVTS